MSSVLEDIVRRQPNPRAQLRLFCVPHAGAGASMFSTWARHLPGSIELCALQLPGREDRITEPTPPTLAALVEDLLPALASYLDLPFVWFGHSSGALIATELVRRLAYAGARAQRLVVSGCRAPHLPRRGPSFHELSDLELICELRKLDGIPEAALDNAELMELVLPRIRADDALAASYRPPGEPLDIALTAVAGNGDPTVDPNELSAWRAHTTAEFRTRIVTGDHFYLTKRPADAVAILLDEIGGIAPDRAPSPPSAAPRGGGMHERLAALLADICGAPIRTLGPEAAPGTTPGWDSIATLGLIVAIEDELGISITTAEAIASKSLGDFARLASAKAPRSLERAQDPG